MALPIVGAFAAFVSRLAKNGLVQSVGVNIVAGALIEVVVGEMAAIRAIDAKIQALVDEPFRTGLDQLRRAQQTSRPSITLEKAYDSFLRAKNIYRPLLPLHSARAAVYCGSCSDMLGERPHANSLYDESYGVMFEQFVKLRQDLSLDGTAVSNFADKNISCRIYTPTSYTRRAVIAQLVKYFTTLSTTKPWFGDNKFERYTELCDHLRPTAELLKVRGSKVANLAEPTRFSWEHEGELVTRRLESICGVRYPN